jgi:predicted RNA-binding Zn-ribbon protein involved in translation (DUF1610 family)
MPLTKDGKQICDGCGKNIDEQLGGYYCPVCGRLYCNECEPDHELVRIQVRENGPDYKKFTDMCPTCALEWRKKNAKVGTLDGYLQAQAP